MSSMSVMASVLLTANDFHGIGHYQSKHGGKKSKLGVYVDGFSNAGIVKFNESLSFVADTITVRSSY